MTSANDLALVPAGAEGAGPSATVAPKRTLQFIAPGSVVRTLFVNPEAEKGSDDYCKLKTNWGEEAVDVFDAAAETHECLLTIDGPTLMHRSESAYIENKRAHKDEAKVCVYQAGRVLRGCPPHSTPRLSSRST